MKQDLEGVYWKIGENEYNLQVSFSIEQKGFILEKFQDWNYVGEGLDPKQNKSIIIFRRRFPDKLEIKRLARELRYNKILLKEVT